MRDKRIKRPYYNVIMTGKKTREVRVGYDSIRRYRVGDLIKLETSQVSGVVKVKSARVYKSFEDMLGIEPWQQIVPDAPNESTALHRLKQIYPPQKEALGVYVFEIEPTRH